MATRGLTEYGTPLAQSWSPEWCESVLRRESELGRRICGARAYDNEPCELPPRGENGRCKCHGGLPGSGAQPGNFNARLHGLYAHRLQTCGDHCPFWERCVHADYAMMDLPAAKRPMCPIEQEEFELFSRKYSERDAHDQHNVALLGVMLGRAARALSLKPIDGDATGTNRSLHAFQRLLRDFQWYRHVAGVASSTDDRWRQPTFVDASFDAAIAEAQSDTQANQIESERDDYVIGYKSPLAALIESDLRSNKRPPLPPVPVEDERETLTARSPSQ